MPRLVRPLLLFTLALMPLSVAAAHPKLLKATPAADSRGGAPRAITLTFNEAITPALSRISLAAAGKRLIAVGELRVAPDDPHAIVVAITTTLAPGHYIVRWQAAAADGHPVRGTFAFEVMGPPAP